MTADLIIFDADGTLRDSISQRYPYPTELSDWRVLPDVVSRLAGINWRRDGMQGMRYGIVSNQPGVALGHIEEALVVRLLMDMFIATFGFSPIPELIKYCPHDRSGACICRKPHPKLILDIIQFWDVDPGKSVYVGDRQTDGQAAANAGCKFLHRDTFFGD